MEVLVVDSGAGATYVEVLVVGSGAGTTEVVLVVGSGAGATTVVLVVGAGAGATTVVLVVGAGVGAASEVEELEGAGATGVSTDALVDALVDEAGPDHQRVRVRPRFPLL